MVVLFCFWLDLIFAVVSPSNSPYEPTNDDRFANSIVAIRPSDLSVEWSYRFLFHDDFIFDYRQPPVLFTMKDHHRGGQPFEFLIYVMPKIKFLNILKQLLNKICVLLFIFVVRSDWQHLLDRCQNRLRETCRLYPIVDIRPTRTGREL